MPEEIRRFIDRWKGNSAGEIATAQQHYLELCGALDVARPTPAEQQAKIHRFEMPVDVLVRQGQRASKERIDVYKKAHFIWENKQGSEKGSGRQGHGRRGSRPWQAAMVAAFNQARRYAVNLPGDAPPFVIVCDVGHHFEIWSDFSGKGKHYSDRPSKLLSYEDLSNPKDADYLRRVMSDPTSLNPATYQDEVTRAVAAELAALAKSLESSEHTPEETSRFLMRCIFTMFAEDVELLPESSFTNLLEAFVPDPGGLPSQLELLWKRMDTGGLLFGVGKIRRFNGGLFHEPAALELSSAQIQRLHRAARHDWANVEPTIFGTLVERALDPVERQRLGAHFTPRAYIERLVRPTVIEPLRDDWVAVQSKVFEVLGDAAVPRPGHVRKAVKMLRDFHTRLCQVRVLDPACGTGNFLYVTYDLVKDLEAEVLRRLEDLGEKQLGLRIASQTVMPSQMLGIEKNPRAREIADLVLWIGHLQRLRRDGAYDAIQDPVIQETDHIECRDAVLAWDGERVPRLDADGHPITVWDMGRKADALKEDGITGQLVPDEARNVVVHDYPNAHEAQWPEADFIVSNPPFVGAGPMRATLGVGYTEALRRAWEHIPESADLVMFWWDRAAELVRQGKVRRFGLITTNSIHQTLQRRIMEPHLGGKPPLSLAFAVPDHPWTTGEGAAAVRIAMTVGVAGQRAGRLVHVTRERPVAGDAAEIETTEASGTIHSNLRIGVDLTRALPLASNRGISSPGVKLHGAGFIVTPQQAAALGLGEVPGLEKHIRHYRNGRDITRSPRGVMVIDLFGLTAEEVAADYPHVNEWVESRVRAQRERKAVNGTADSRKYAELWWLHGKVRAGLRDVLAGLPRYIVTVETAKHRFFQFLDAQVLPDNMLTSIGLSDGWCLGVLSSRIHVLWALAAGGRLEDRPRYNKTRCFEPFPFPDLAGRDGLRDRIGDLAVRLDAHRKRVQGMGRVAGRQADLTNQYNALQRARQSEAGGTALSPKERTFHGGALIGTLRRTHDDLDAAVAEAYGWPVDLSDEGVLERLLALNHERAMEETTEDVRWLRPDIQASQAHRSPSTATAGRPSAPRSTGAARALPSDDGERLAAVRDVVVASAEPLSTDEVTSAFKGARRKTVGGSLASLAVLGLVVRDDGGLWSGMA